MPWVAHLQKDVLKVSSNHLKPAFSSSHGRVAWIIDALQPFQHHVSRLLTPSAKPSYLVGALTEGPMPGGGAVEAEGMPFVMPLLLLLGA